MSSSKIETLLDEVQAAFDRRPEDIETGLAVEDAALLQLRKACRLLTGADALRDEGYYTLVIEASFVAIERTVELTFGTWYCTVRYTPRNSSGRLS